MNGATDPNLVEIVVNGMSYRGWTDVTVTAALDEAARTFSVEITEQSPLDMAGEFMGWPVVPDDEVQVRLGGQVVVTGVVDSRQASYTFQAHGVQVSGRSKTADAIDGSIDEKGGEFKKVRLDALAKKLAAEHDIEVTIEGDTGKEFDVVRVQPGETTFELIDRLARQRGFTITDDENGNLVLRKEGEESAPIRLVEGENILSGRATFKGDQKYSKVKVKSQRPRASDDDEEADGEEADGDYFDDIEAEAEDTATKRKRTLVIQAEEPVDKEGAQERADREVAKRKAEAIEAGFTVQGFFSSPGKLWKPGDRVHVISPMLLLDRVLVVKSLTFKQSFSAGSTTELALTIPEALKSGKGSGKGKNEGGASGPAEGGDYWKEGGKGSGKAAPAKGKTPSTGGSGGKSFPVSNYWSDQA